MCMNVMGSSLKFEQMPGMSLGHVAMVRPLGCLGLSCLLPWGAAAAGVLRMLGLNPAANISRNVPEGWLRCYVGDVA